MTRMPGGGQSVAPSVSLPPSLCSPDLDADGDEAEGLVRVEVHLRERQRGRE